MSESKMRRLVAASTAAAVVVLFILLAVLVYQIVGLASRKRAITQLDAEQKRLEQMISETEEETRRALTDKMREYEARRRGYEYTKK